MRNVAALVLVAGSASAMDFTQIDASYFAGAAVVGVDAIADPIGTPMTVGFDFAPDGSAIDTPTQLPGSVLFVSSSLETVFQPLGLRIDAGSVALSQPSAPGGIGVRSGMNVLASEAAVPPNGDIEFMFANGVSAAGFWTADGPTNDVAAWFYDKDGGLIANLEADEVQNYLGIESTVPIARILISTSMPDDYYIEDLSFINVPAPASAVVLAAGGLVATRRRR